MTTAELERRYRRLLWAYPGSYRRRHGTEIVTTLLDMAEAGHRRPRAAQALHLVLCGLRQRFRLPAGRPLAAIAAMLAVLTLGALGASAGTWLGWQAATAPPSADEMRALTAATSGIDPGGVPVEEWETGMTGPAVLGMASGRLPHSAERIRTALTSDGWRITSFTETAGGVVVAPFKEPFVTVPMSDIQVRAVKDGLSLALSSSTVTGSAEYDVEQRMDHRVDVWTADTAAVRPLAIAGLLLGALAGWLIVAVLAYRVRQSGPAHRTAAGVLGAAVLAAAVVPAFAACCDLYQVMIYDTANPNPYIVDSPSDQLPAGLVPTGTGIALLLLAGLTLIAVRGARRGAARTEPESVVPG